MTKHQTTSPFYDHDFVAQRRRRLPRLTMGDDDVQALSDVLREQLRLQHAISVTRDFVDTEMMAREVLGFLMARSRKR